MTKRELENLITAKKQELELATDFKDRDLILYEIMNYQERLDRLIEENKNKE